MPPNGDRIRAQLSALDSPLQADLHRTGGMQPEGPGNRLRSDTCKTLAEQRVERMDDLEFPRFIELTSSS